MKTVKKNTQAASALKSLRSNAKPALTGMKRTTGKQVKNVKDQKISDKNLVKIAKTIKTANSPKNDSVQKQVKKIDKINGACSTRADVKNSRRVTPLKITSSPSENVKMVKNIINAKSLEPSPSKNVKKEVKDLIKDLMNNKSLKIVAPLSKNVKMNLKGNSDINTRTKSLTISRTCSPNTRLKTSPMVPSSASSKAKAQNTKNTTRAMPRGLSGTGNSGSSSTKEKSVCSRLSGKEKCNGSSTGSKEKSGSNAKEKITNLSGKEKKHGSGIKENITSSGTSSTGNERSTSSGSSGKEIMTNSGASGKEKIIDSSSKEKCSSSSGTKRSSDLSTEKSSDPSISSGPTVSEPDLSNIKTLCLICNSTVRGKDIMNHLFFNVLRCRECVSKISTCNQFAAIENSSVGCAMNKDEPHGYLDWQDPLMHLSYAFRKNLSIDNYIRGINTAPTMHQITDKIKEYMTPLYILRELDPWKHAFKLFFEHTPVDPKSLPPPLRSVNQNRQQDSQTKGKQDLRRQLQPEQQQPTLSGVMKEVTPSNKGTQRCDMQGQDHPSTSIVPDPVIKDTSTQKANDGKVCSLGVHNQKTSDIARFNQKQSLKKTESDSQALKRLDTSSTSHQKDLDVSIVRKKTEKDLPYQNAEKTTAVSQPSQKANLPSKLLKDCKKKDNLANKTSSHQSSAAANITSRTPKRIVKPSTRYQHNIKILKVQNTETPTKETEVANVRKAKENAVVSENIGDRKNEKQARQTKKADSRRGSASNKSIASSTNKEITSKSVSKEVSLGRGGIRSCNSSDESKISGKVKPEESVEQSSSKDSTSVGQDTSNTTDIRPDTKNNNETKFCMNFEAESSIQENVAKNSGYKIQSNDNNSKHTQCSTGMSKRGDTGTLLETSQIDCAINSDVKPTQPFPIKRKLHEESPLSPLKKKVKKNEIYSILTKLTSITVSSIALPDSPIVQTNTENQMKTPISLIKTPPKIPIRTPPESLIRTPPESSIRTPPESSIRTPPESSIRTPPESSIRTPPESSIRTPPESSIRMPPESSIRTPPENSIGTPPESSIRTPPKSSIRTPPKSSIKTPPKSSIKTPIRTPPGSSIRTPPKTSIKTPPKSLIRTPPKSLITATTENQMKSLESRMETLQKRTISPSDSPMKASPDCIHITLTTSRTPSPCLTPSPEDSYSTPKKASSPTKTLEANTKSLSKRSKQKSKRLWWCRYKRKGNRTQNKQTEGDETDETDDDDDENDDDQVNFIIVSEEDLKTGRFLVSGDECPEECPECYCFLEVSLVNFKLNVTTNVVNIICPSCRLSIYIKKKNLIQ